MVEWIWFIDYGLENKPKIIRKIFGNLAKNYVVEKKTMEFQRFEEMLEYDVNVKEVIAEEVHQILQIV